MANLFIVNVTQKNSSGYKKPQQAAFDTSESLIVEDKQYLPNVSYILYGGDKYYTQSTVDDLVALANASGSETILATIIQVDGNQSPSRKYGFPTQNISIWPTSVAGANCSITFKGSSYYAAETIDSFVAAGNQPADITFGSPGDPAGPLGSDGVLPIGQLPVTQTGEANKIPQLDNGGTLILENSTQRAEYGANSIFLYGPNATWMDLDASGMEIDLIGQGRTIHMGLDGLDAADQPITTSHTATAANEVVIKSLLDSAVAGVVSGITYKGSWNAATNTPTLANGVGVNGDMYKVSVAGTRDLGGGSIVFEVGDHVVYVAGSLNEWENFGASEPVAANPTVTVGLTVKNGSSPNFMRSDAAPALDQTIAPTWTQLHKFSAGLNAKGVVSAAANEAATAGPTNSGAVLGEGPNYGNLSLYDSTQTANNRSFDLINFQGKIQFRLKNDTGGSVVLPLVFSGGQAAGITGIESNSGTGVWAHTGAFSKTGLDTVVTGADGVKMWLAKYTTGTGHNNAPTAIGATSNYLQVGGREYGNNGFGGIGFGYVSAPTDHPCVWIGYEEKNPAGNTSGDFIIAVRNVTTDTAPTEAFRIKQDGTAAFAHSVSVNGADVRGIVASDGKTAQSANINSPTLYAVPASGMYRVSVFVVLSRAATTSSVLPGLSVSYTEATTGVAVQDIVTQTANTNTLGLHMGGSVIISAQQGSNIGYTTSNYASSGATSMQYSVSLKIEFLG